MIKKVIASTVLAIALAVVLAICVFSADASADCEYISSVGNGELLKDGSVESYVTFGSGGTLEIHSAEPIYCVYVKFYTRSVAWQLELGGEMIECGQNGYLHEAVRVGGESSLRLIFPSGADVAEVAVYGSGEIPSNVQFWSEPHEKADLLLLSTHSDDEHLFFAGIIPYYAGELGYNVQVVYMTNHNWTPVRLHEQLDGLWCAGERNYPVIGDFPDLYSETLDGALQSFAQYGYSYTYDSVVEFQVEILRRFKPKVVVGHDVRGEYSHGQHILNTATLMDALPLAADPSAYPESAAKYGTHDTPKAYLHLWDLGGETQIVMNWDVPLTAFGGKTAYQVSCDAFGYHKSQHWTWFFDWLLNPDGSYKASVFEISSYSPCYYGLYRSTVGADVNKNDMFENITPYKDEIPPETDPPSTGDAASDQPASTDESISESSTQVTPIQSESGDVTKTEERSFDYGAMIAVVTAVFLVAVIVIVIIDLRSVKNKKRPRR